MDSYSFDNESMRNASVLMVLFAIMVFAVKLAVFYLKVKENPSFKDPGRKH